MARAQYREYGALHEGLTSPAEGGSGGGCIVAIVGADGSGKTAAINGLMERLGQDREIARIYMGSPRWTIPTLIIRGLLKVARLLFGRGFVRQGAEGALFTETPIFPGYGWLVYEACMAFDRYCSYRRAKQQANKGRLVLCDRYPLPQIKLADGPQIRRVTAACHHNIAIDAAARFEERCYRAIQLPDLVLVLDVDPNVAIERKRNSFSGESPAQIAACAREVHAIDWGSLSVHIMDANRPINTVISNMEAVLCSAAWRLKAELLPESLS